MEVFWVRKKDTKTIGFVLITYSFFGPHKGVHYCSPGTDVELPSLLGIILQCPNQITLLQLFRVLPSPTHQSPQLGIIKKADSLSTHQLFPTHLNNTLQSQSGHYHSLCTGVRVRPRVGGCAGTRDMSLFVLRSDIQSLTKALLLSLCLCHFGCQC